MTPEQRRLNMSRVRGRDTKPEMLLRRGLHARGLRYHVHDRTMPGRPDLVLPKYRTAVFAHGCSLSKLPATRPKFWKQTLEANAARYRDTIFSLLSDRWRVLVIWECALRGSERLDFEAVLDHAAVFIRAGEQ
ncbi:very short patch repair endonuclease [Methylococcus capsulatus]|jgi:DNA mismatch endonuclease (patch repair protein)|uniref:very short patch repair endonuclease n=1 Tax=Methylococcus capsulatus TaxID=414 RepID=UPI00211B10E4|nr:very short patch repair endonuclease [Methylococcus capsulatus]